MKLMATAKPEPATVHGHVDDRPMVQQGRAGGAPAYLQRQPAPPTRRGRVLIAADAKREKARKLSGQTTTKVCRSISVGADKSNLTLIPRKNHLTGHSRLAHQPQMLKPTAGLKPMLASLYDAGHTAGTMCRLKGFKSSRTESC